MRDFVFNECLVGKIGPDTIILSNATWINEIREAYPEYRVVLL